jgi:hypothetical protein
MAIPIHLFGDNIGMTKFPKLSLLTKTFFFVRIVFWEEIFYS